MIKSLKIEKLNKRISNCWEFHDDINIITGKNGSGKTTLLKLMWYALSGNLERIIPEINFESFELTTDKFYVSMSISRTEKRHLAQVKYRINDGQENKIERRLGNVLHWNALQNVNRALVDQRGTSILFPTFRRIEGGFSIGNREDTPDELSMFGLRNEKYSQIYYGSESDVSLQNAVNSLSSRLSVDSNLFVASISTQDIVRILTTKYAEISEQTNRFHMELSKFILENVQSKTNGNKTSDPPFEQRSAKEVLNALQAKARELMEKSQALLRPFNVLNELIAKIFKYKGIKLSDPLTLGEAKEAIASHLLSAGEKQMLSFLCYNAFSANASIFIDEPEISLHVDWQRVLFPVLLKQSTGNQFIIATHSPFIYSMYSDKELLLSEERGDENVCNTMY